MKEELQTSIEVYPVVDAFVDGLNLNRSALIVLALEFAFSLSHGFDHPQLIHVHIPAHVPNDCDGGRLG